MGTPPIYDPVKDRRSAREYGQEKCLVRVAPRDLDDIRPVMTLMGCSNHTWDLAEVPQIGDRVVFIDFNGIEQYGIVCEVDDDLDEDFWEDHTDEDGPLFSPVLSLVSETQIEQARNQGINAQDQWLNALRYRAGMPGPASSAETAAGLPDVPPEFNPNADGDQAGQIAKTWWKAAHSARDNEEATAFKNQARKWYKLHDQFLVAEQDERRRRENPGTLVRGKHHFEWIEPIKQLKREGKHDEALALLEQCREASILEMGDRPTAWYFEQEAIIRRKNKEPEKEVEILKDYIRRSAEPSQKLVQRLKKLESPGTK